MKQTPMHRDLFHTNAKIFNLLTKVFSNASQIYINQSIVSFFRSTG